MSNQRQLTHADLVEFSRVARKWAPFFTVQVQIAVALRDDSGWHLCYALNAFSVETPSPEHVPVNLETASIRAFRRFVALNQQSASKAVEEALDDPMGASTETWTARLKEDTRVGLKLDYERLHPVRMAGPKRTPALIVTPSKQTAWRFPTIKELDQELQSHSVPYDGLTDLLFDLGVPVQLAELEQKPLVELILIAPVSVDESSRLQSGKMSLAITMPPRFEPSKLRVGIKAFRPARPPLRLSLTGDQLSWASDGSAKRAVYEADFADVPGALALLSYDGEYMCRWWLRDTTLSFNERLQLHRTVDPTDQLIRTFFEAKNDFEDRVTLLLTLLNLLPLKYGEIQHLTDGPDILALSASNHLYVIDCTTGDINNKGKLLKLHERSKKIREALSHATRPPIAVLPVVFTSLLRQETAAHWSMAAALQIAIVAKENILNLFDRIEAPPTAHELYTAALACVPSAQAPSTTVQ
jgi:hypothetical protein